MATVERNASWLRWIVPEQFNDANLIRIVTFFVFHSPCPKVSAMGRTLAEYGWNTPWRKPIYLNKQLKRASTSNHLLFSASSLSKLDEALKQASLSGDFSTADFSYERVCTYDKLNNQFLSVFLHIRNAFAHGRLNMIEIGGECVFLFEDVIPKNKSNELTLSARMVLLESTLLNWIDIIEAGEKPF